MRRVSLAVLVGGCLLAGTVVAAEPSAEQKELQERAAALSREGMQRYRQGDAAAGARLLREAVAAYRRLYPTETHPQGHPELAQALNYLGWVLSEKGEHKEGEATLQKAVAMDRKLYPADRYPRGHAALAQSLLNLAIVLERQGETVRALQAQREALAIRRRLYPAREYPNGHVDLAWSLSNVGSLLRIQKEYAEAAAHLEEAVALWRKLFPSERYPQGTSELADTLMILGDALAEQHQGKKAQAAYEEALAIRRKLYPPERFPKGHPDLATSLFTLGRLLLERDDAAGLRYLEEGVTMDLRLQPQGSVRAPAALAFLASFHAKQSRYDEAVRYGEKALSLFRRLYPADRYPQGHPYLARILSDLGDWSQKNKDERRARAYLEEAVQVFRKLPPQSQLTPQRAAALKNLANLLQDEAEYDLAVRYREEALPLYQSLYPARQYPDGHDDLLHTLRWLGVALLDQGDYSRARDYLEQAWAMAKKLHPADRESSNRRLVGQLLNELTHVYVELGDHARARAYIEEAVDLYRKLYPPDKYPRGHTELAQTLANLGTLLSKQGEKRQAAAYTQEALAMRRRLYPEKEYPRGLEDLASSLHNIADVLAEQGKKEEALDYAKQALAMRRKLYPAESHPRGHPALARDLLHVGERLSVLGKYRQATVYLEESLAMQRTLYPAETYPNGHPGIADTLGELGQFHWHQGRREEAVRRVEEALAMYDKLYPADRYPQGTTQLAYILWVLGQMFQMRADYARALECAERQAAMERKLFEVFAAGSSEAEALNFAARRHSPVHVLLSASPRLGVPAARVYRHLWGGKAATARLLQQRRRLVSRDADPQTRTLSGQLLATRHALAHRLLAPADQPGPGVEELTRRKEDLERRLAARLPALARRQLEEQGPEALARRLPRRSLFIDFFLYYHLGKGDEGAWHYAAFVVKPGGEVGRAELGPVAPIHRAVLAWREEITGTADRPGEAAATLRRLLWQSLARLVPAGTDMVWLCPEGALTALPWAALPGAKEGTVLLEEHALAVVPYGPFLLAQLAAEPDKGARVLLAVGGVDYGRASGTAREGGQTESLRAPPRQGRLVWKPLPGTDRERRLVEALARDVVEAEVLDLHGPQAGPAPLVQGLPRARWAHLATHGFFADQKFRSALRLSEEQFLIGAERSTAGARNPLVLSGLVLAGANGGDERDGGILTAESIAGLNLDRLELAVLSACETGLGQVAGGEGVFGLQRAFHLAGTRHVVASLWQVEDEATAALMALFYRKLWVEKKLPAQALREAQLHLYHHPDDIPALAQRRGLALDRPEDLPAEEPTPAPRPRGKTAPTARWAAFVLSGGASPLP